MSSFLKNLGYAPNVFQMTESLRSVALGSGFRGVSVDLINVIYTGPSRCILNEALLLAMYPTNKVASYNAPELLIVNLASYNVSNYYT